MPGGFETRPYNHTHAYSAPAPNPDSPPRTLALSRHPLHCWVPWPLAAMLAQVTYIIRAGLNPPLRLSPRTTPLRPTPPHCPALAHFRTTHGLSMADERPWHPYIDSPHSRTFAPRTPSARGQASAVLTAWAKCTKIRNHCRRGTEPGPDFFKGPGAYRAGPGPAAEPFRLLEDEIRVMRLRTVPLFLHQHFFPTRPVAGEARRGFRRPGVRPSVNMSMGEAAAS